MMMKKMRKMGRNECVGAEKGGRLWHPTRTSFILHAAEQSERTNRHSDRAEIKMATANRNVNCETLGRIMAIHVSRLHLLERTPEPCCVRKQPRHLITALMHKCSPLSAHAFCPTKELCGVAFSNAICIASLVLSFFALHSDPW